MMAIDKLFQVLVVGGVALGNQACAKKGSPEIAEPVDSSEQEADANENPETEETEDLKTPRDSRMLENSNGEKCEDICDYEASGEVICSDMCCWLMAVECCPSYRGQVLEEEAEETQGSEEVEGTDDSKQEPEEEKEE
jgi:hypothetical protein